MAPEAVQVAKSAAVAERARTTSSELARAASSGVRLNAVTTIVVTALQLGQLVILARLLSPSDFGFMAMTMVVVVFAQTFAAAGLSNAIIYRQDATPAQLSSIYWLGLGVGSLLYAVVLGVAPLVAAFYGEPRIHQLLALMALVFLIVPPGQQFQVLLQKTLRFDRLAATEVAGAVLGTTAAVLAALAGHGVFALVWGQLTTFTTTALLLIALGWSTWRPTLHFDPRDLKGYLAFGLFQMGERSTNYFASNLDKLLIGHLLGGVAVGIYSVAYQLIVRPMQALNPIITRVAFPVFATIQADDPRLRRGYLQVIEMIAFISTPLYLGMFALADPIVATLLGDQWHAAAAVVHILAFLGLLYSLINPIGSLLLAKGRADLGFAFNVLGLALYAVAIVVGSRWGIEGVAWGLLAATVSVLLPLEFLVRWRLVGMRPAEWIKVFAPFLLIAAIMTVAVIGVDRLASVSNRFLRLGVMVPLGIAVYAGGVLVWRPAFLRNVADLARKPR